MNKILLTLLLFLSSYGYAAIEKVNNRLQGTSDLSVGNKIATTDNKYHFIMSNGNWANILTNKRLTNSIRLGVDQSKNWTPPLGYSCTVEVSIKYWDAGGILKTLPNRTLEVDYSAIQNINYTDIDLFEFDGGIKAEIKILTITENVSGQSYLDNIFLELEIESERYYHFDYASFPPSPATIDPISFNNDFFSRKLVNDNQDLEITWDVIVGAEAYDIEWTYVTKYQSSGYVYTFDFKSQCSRIRTSKNSLQLPLVYEAGELLYRLRPIYRSNTNGDNFQTPLEGRWSNFYITDNKVSTYPTNAKYEIIPYTGTSTFLKQEFEPGIPWNYTIIYDEFGKYSNALSFHDAIGKTRQGITRSQQKKDVIVSSTIYDFYGRPAVEVLPTPMATQSMEYKESLNKWSGSSSQSFDYDQSCAPRLLNFNSLTSKGSANYYSSDNSDKDGAEKYLPDAEGFTFIQKEYRQDNSGAITRVNLPGADYKYGSGKETTTTYGNTVDESELSNFFAADDYSNYAPPSSASNPNIEGASFPPYTMTTKKDPNQVITQSIFNNSGQVVLSKVLGNASKDLEALPTTSYSNIKDLNKGDLLKITYNSTITEPGTYEINYSMVPPSYNECGFCFPCNYEFDLKAKWYKTPCSSAPTSIIVHEEGKGATVYPPTPSCSTATPINLPSTYTSSTSSSMGSMSFTILAVDLLNGPINIEIIKELVPKEDMLDHWQEFYGQNYCGNGPEYYLDDFEPYTCDGTYCEEKFFMEYGRNPTEYFQKTGITINQTTYDAYKTAYLETCDVDQTACDAYLSMLRKDFWPPDGKYVYDGFNTSLPEWTHSFLNTATTSFHYTTGTGAAPGCTLNVNFLSPVFTSQYTDEHNNPVTVNSIQDYKDKFQPHWTDFLIKAHPEYICAKFACGENTDIVAGGAYNKSPFDYDLLMKSTNTFNKACSLGLLNPLNYSTTSGLITTTGSSFNVQLPSSYGLPTYDDFYTNTNSKGNADLATLTTYMNQTFDKSVMFPSSTPCASMPSYYNLWTAAYIIATANDMTSCSTIVARGNASLNGGNNFDLDDMDCDKDLWWQYFKALYLSKRSQLLENKMVQNSGSLKHGGTDCMCNHPLGRTLKYTVDAFGTIGTINLTGNPKNYGSTKLNNLLNTNNHNNCTTMANAAVSTWIRDLAGCSLTTAQKAAIEPDLIGVFINACKNDGPLGAQQSSIPFTPTSGGTFYSFDDVLTYHLGANYKTELCSPLLIKAPSYANPVAKIQFLDDCGCNAIVQNRIDYDTDKGLNNLPSGVIDESDYFEHHYGYVIDNISDKACQCLASNPDSKNGEVWSASELSSLSTKKIMVPEGFECEKCITCEIIDDELTQDAAVSDQFVDDYPNHVGHANTHLLLAQFINKKYEVDIAASEIDAMRKACYDYKQSSNLKSNFMTTQEAKDVEKLLDELVRFKLLGPGLPPYSLKMGHDIYYSSLHPCAADKTNKVSVETMALNTFNEWEIDLVGSCVTGSNVFLEEPYSGFDLTTISSFKNLIPVFSSGASTTNKFEITAVLNDYTSIVINGSIQAHKTHKDRILNSNSALDLSICSYGITKKGEDPIPDCGNRERAFKARSKAIYDYEKQLEIDKKLFRKNYKNACNQIDETYTLTSESNPAAITLSYYDLAGNLVQTVPPSAVNTGGNTIHNTEMATEYDYNSLNAVTYSKSPDGGITKFWYDYLGRIIVSQNQLQLEEFPNDPAYSYTLYDELGRMKETGKVRGPFNPGPITDAIAKNQNDFMAWITDNTTIPTGSLPFKTEVTRYIYDDQIPSIASRITNALSKYALPEYQNFTQQNLRGNIVSTIYFEEYNLPSVVGYKSDEEYDNAIHYSYDQHGNVKYYLQDIKELDILEQPIKVMKYTYDLISSQVMQMDYQEGELDQLIHKYEYDLDNKLNEVLVSTDGRIWNREADYKYYRNGWLARKELSQNKVQGMDYAYTVQGWLKGVNSTTLNSSREIGKDSKKGNGYLAQENNLHKSIGHDAFGFNLIYNTTDYKSIDLANTTTSDYFLASLAGSPIETDFNNTGNGHNMYGGNIGGMATAIMDQNNDILPAQFRSFKYDVLYRLKNMNNYSDAFVHGTNDYTAAQATTDYLVDLNYTIDGDITDLIRNTFTSGGMNEMDHLTYSYLVKGSTPGHQLHMVEDFANNGTTDIQQGQLPNNYTYDQIGQLTQDISINVDNGMGGKFEWTNSGKLKTLKRGTGLDGADLAFIYGADNRRWVKTVKYKDGNGDLLDERSWTSTYYVYDVTGNIIATYNKYFSPTVEYILYCPNEDVEEINIYQGEFSGSDIHGGTISFNAMDPIQVKAQNIVQAINSTTTNPNFQAVLWGGCVKIFLSDPSSGSMQDFRARTIEGGNELETPLQVYTEPNSGLHLKLAEHNIYGSERLGIITQNKPMANATFQYNIDPTELTFDIDYGTVQNTLYTGKMVVLVYDNPVPISFMMGNGTTGTIALKVNNDDLFTQDAINYPTFAAKTYYNQLVDLAARINGSNLTDYAAYVTNKSGFWALVVYSTAPKDPSINYDLNATTLNIDNNESFFEQAYKNVIGKRMYELANHLGNVIEVVSDKKIANFVYTPFLTEDFNSGTLGGFIASHANTSLFNRNNKLHVINNVIGDQNILMEQSFTLAPNTKYTIEFDISDDQVQQTNWRISDGGTVLIDNWTNQTSAGSQHYSMSFMTIAGNVKFEFKGDMGSMTGSSSSQNFAEFKMDNFKVLQASTNTDVPLAEVISHTDYYPFGMPMPGRNGNLSAYRYGFNGMEKDNEKDDYGNSYTTEFRQYDPRIARWLSVDPLAAKYPYQSPYAAFNNNPIYFADPTGLEGEGRCQNCPTEAKEGGIFEGTYTHTEYSADGFIAYERKQDYVYHGGSEDHKAGWYTREQYGNMIAKDAYEAGFENSSPYAAGLPGMDQTIPNYLAVDKLDPSFVDNWASIYINAWKYGRSESHLASGRIDMVSLDKDPIFMALSLGVSFYSTATRSTVVYRTMSDEAAEIFIKTGKMPAGTETFISSSKAFASGYEGTIFRINLKPSTISQLEGIGVRNAASGHPMSQLPLVSKGWKSTNAFFKVEGTQLNIGLGNGKALDIFNSGIKSFKKVN
ncbi:MAG: hypothetical protein CL840_07470 [Crocinitomicaceae bacterium]|nr:hypothetical protein [Crocinitomicaceae bacterium]|tara:strand:- start:5765 stop:15085 length:9321 start_codon:yes stop_codon:yes gene_type:complete